MNDMITPSSLRKRNGAESYRELVADAQSDLRTLLVDNGAGFAMQVVHVVPSGMARDISVFAVDEIGRIKNVSWTVARALELPYVNNAVRIQGVGMNMMFALSMQIDAAIGTAAGYYEA